MNDKRGIWLEVDKDIDQITIWFGDEITRRCVMLSREDAQYLQRLLAEETMALWT